jgi:transcriptional regulator
MPSIYTHVRSALIRRGEIGRSPGDNALIEITRRREPSWLTCCFPNGNVQFSCWYPSERETGQGRIKQKKDVQQGTLALMVLKTLDGLGPLHGYGIARRIEQISGELLSVNQGTLYPVVLRLEQEGAIASEWGPSENNRRARFYRLTRAGRKLLEVERRDWDQTAAIIAHFFEVKAEDLA